jgi:hypothetical protein
LLHKIPPPSQTLKPNAAGDYRPLARTSRSLSPPGFSDGEDVRGESFDSVRDKRGKSADEMNGSGWWALGWSFAASGAMTVTGIPI